MESVPVTPLYTDEIVGDPAVTAVSKPTEAVAFDTVADASEDESQMALLVRSSVRLSE
jgi:hypothetical protein